MSEQPDPLREAITAINEHADIRLRDGRLAIARDHAVEVLRAALTNTPAPDLDAAWAEAEAALPEGWQMELGRLDFDGPWDAFAKSRAFWEDDFRVGDREEQMASGEGPTPAAALRALAARLTDLDRP